MNNFDLLKKDLEEFNLTMNSKQEEQFMKYYEILVEWNSFMNLTGIVEFEEVCKKHFLDSISLCQAIDLMKEYTVIDVGTGAGFPGIPLKIMFPDLKITLLDSLQKRIKFLDQVIETCDLANVKTIHGRAEDFGKNPDYREQYDLCVSRAVANLSSLCEFCLPFVKLHGQFISYKSEKLEEEIKTSKSAVFLLGGKVRNQVDFSLPNSDIYRNLLVIDKVNGTPKKYPRKAGMPTKNPL